MSNLIDYLLPLKDISIFAIGGFLIKGYIEKKEKRSLEVYKYDLNKQLENHKSQLEKELDEHKSGLSFLNQKLSVLHLERLNRIKEMHGKIRDLFSNMVKWNSEFATVVFNNETEKRKIEEELLTNTAKSYAEFHDYVLENKMYFDRALADRLMEIKKELYDIRNDMFHNLAFRDLADKEPIWKLKNVDRLVKASQTIVTKLPNLMEELEDEFRILLGARPNGV